MEDNYSKTSKIYPKLQEELYDKTPVISHIQIEELNKQNSSYTDVRKKFKNMLKINKWEVVEVL